MKKPPLSNYSVRISNKETFLRFILSSILDDPDLLMAFTFEIKSETLSGLS